MKEKNNKFNFKKVINNRYYYLLPIIIVLINLVFFNKFYQPTEGWWQTFGYLINEGLEPYKDFSSAIVPSFMYFNAFLLDIFGDKLILFRLFGIVTVLTTIILLQWLLSKLTNKIAATLAVFTAFALNMSTPVYLAYDYSSYIDILLISIFIAYYTIIKYENFYLTILNSVFIGILLSILLLMKQNIGAFFGLAIVVAILIHRNKNKFLIVMAIFTSSILVIFKFSTLMDLESASNEIFLNNDAKGSILTVLFRFILDSYNLKILIFSILFTFIALLINKYKHFIENNIYWNKFKSKKAIHISLIAIVSLVYVMLFFHIEPFYDKFFLGIMIITISTFLFIIYNVLIQKEITINNNFIPFLLPIVSLAYCTTHTAGYNFIGMYFVVAFSLAYLLYEFQDIKFKEYLYLALIILMINIMLSKIFMPYNWWGLTQSSIFKAKYETNYKQLQGIKVDEKTKDLFNTIKYNIDKFSTTKDDIFVYPHIPIFYFLHHKKPPVKSIIQWFDFATTFQLKSDLEILKKKLPKVIVLLKPPEFVYKGHYGLLKHKLIQKNYDEFFNNLILSKIYHIEHISSFNNKKDLSQFDKKNIDIIIANNNITINNIVNTINLPISNYQIENITKKGFSENMNINMSMNMTMNIGDKVTIKANEDITDTLVQRLGYFYNEKDNYILTILVKNEK